MLGIDTRDLSGDGRAFAEKFGLSYPQLRDGDGAGSDDFGTDRGAGELPRRPAGRCALLARGPVSADYLREKA